jgi:hypothetical protein
LNGAVCCSFALNGVLKKEKGNDERRKPKKKKMKKQDPTIVRVV